MNIVSTIATFERAGLPVITHRRITGDTFQLFLSDGRKVSVNVRDRNRIGAAIKYIHRAQGGLCK